jgi:hypothetical protein
LAPLVRFALLPFAVSCVSVLGFYWAMSALLAMSAMPGAVGVDILNPRINQARLGL